MKHLIAPSVNVFVIKGNKVLLSRRAITGWMDGYLCPPGGHVEKGETPLIAIVREIKEELGVKVKEKDLEFVCVDLNKLPEDIIDHFAEIIKEGIINNKPYLEIGY
jgi:mutator protein MutT